MEISNLAKITRPRVGRVYERERLFNALDALEEQSGVWISAPGGSGKTTLIVSHLQSNKLPALWYQIDADDNDPASFFYYMGLAAGKAAPRRRKPLPVLTPEYMGGLPTFSRNFFRELFSRLTVPSLFVLDNYQDVALKSPLHGLLAEALAEIPPGIRPVICSRSDPPHAFSRLCANNSLSVFGWEDMKLTRDECIEVTQLRTGKKQISTDEAKSLCDVTGGWMTGLILMLEESDGANVRCSLDNPKSQQKVFDYFAGEILLHMDEGLQDFLLKTSQLKEIDIQTACLLNENPDAEKILKSLARRNYFTYRHAGTAGTFEFHPLFRHFLRQEARSRYSVNEHSRLQTRAGKLHEQAGRFEEAASLYIESSSHEDLIALILKQAESLLPPGSE